MLGRNDETRARPSIRFKLNLGLLWLYMAVAGCVYPDPFNIYYAHKVAGHDNYKVRVVGLGTGAPFLEWRAKRINFHQETMPDPLEGRAPLSLANSGCAGAPTLWTKRDEFNPPIQIRDTEFTEIEQSQRDFLFRIAAGEYRPRSNQASFEVFDRYRHVAGDPCRALVERTVDGPSKDKTSSLVVISGTGRLWLDVEVPF